MEVKNNQPQNIDWVRLTRKTDKINRFLQDLTPDTVGDGRMMYNEGEDTLHSRSSFFKGSRIVQYVATIGTKGASFDETRDGFAKLHKRCVIIHDQIATYKPQNREECSRESVEYLFELLELQKKIDGINEQGFEKLVANYRTLHKTGEAINLESLGRGAFEKIYLSSTLLKHILIAKFPDLQHDILIKLSFSDCAQVLLPREQYRANLRKTVWSKGEGLRIPIDLVADSIKDTSFRDGDARPEALRSAAAAIEFPQQSTPVPTLQGDQVWTPARKDGKGVVGTCEKGGHLRNAYSRVDKNTGHLMISCGAFDTRQKAEDLLKIIQSIPRDKREGTFVVHQLESYSYRKNSIEGTHAQIPYLVEELQKMALISPIYHLNTCFDANATSSSEEGVFRKINLESFLNIADHICKEIPVDHLSSSSKKFAQEVAATKQFLDTSKDFSPVKAETREAFEVAHTEVGKGSVTLVSYLEPAIKELSEIKSPSLETRKALLLYKILQDLFLNRKNSAKPLSTTAEIERYLLLYRMLNIKPIFVCENGLDNSAVVRSLAEAQYRLEELFFEGAKENNDVKELARLEAQEKLYRLLQNIEEWKGELFKKQKAKIAELKFPLVNDLADHSTRKAALAAHQELDKNLRNKLLSMFTNDNDQKADDLFHTLVYLELVFGSLLLEQEKTLNSSGALGYRFYHDERKWGDPYKNPHPIERWPLFILTTQGMPIQILETHEPSMLWNTDLLTLTKAGIDLTHRAGYLR